jgi:hypothetical protein
MTFTGDQVARLKIMDVVTDFGNPADKLMADRHGYGNSFLGPLVPFINVEVRTTNGGIVNLYEYIVDTDLRNGNFF